MLARVALMAALVSVGACSWIFPPREIRILQARLDGAETQPTSATAQRRSRGPGEAAITVMLSTDDVQYLTSQEIYLGVDVFDCDRPEFSYPADPLVENVSFSEFERVQSIVQRAKSDAPVEVRGRVHDNFLRGAQRICVTLEGGSMLQETITSNVVRVR